MLLFFDILPQQETKTVLQIYRPRQLPSLPRSKSAPGYRVFTGGKAAGRGADHPPSSSAEVKKV
jgi:hypothetical protein